MSEEHMEPAGPRVRWGVWLMAGIAAAVIGLAVLFVDVIPPTALTRTRTKVIGMRIREYWRINHRLPESLADLPKVEENRDGSTDDGWGRAIRYEKKGAAVTLTSLGKDGRPGGEGEDADIREAFTVGTAQTRKGG